MHNLQSSQRATKGTSLSRDWLLYYDLLDENLEALVGSFTIMQENCTDPAPWKGTWKGTKLFPGAPQEEAPKEHQKIPIVSAVDPTDQSPRSITDDSVQEAPEPNTGHDSSTGQEGSLQEGPEPNEETGEEFPNDDGENPPTEVQEAPFFGNSRHEQVNQPIRDYECNLQRRPLFRCLRCFGCGCGIHLPRRWPRTFWFFFGVVAPLWVLILMSILCGYGLALLEAPYEIVGNDALLKTSYQIKDVRNFTQLIIAKIPQICMKLYALNQTSAEAYISVNMYQYDADEFFEAAKQWEPKLVVLLHQALNDDVWNLSECAVNATDMFDFMGECGQVFQSHLYDIQAVGETLILQQGEITFNWARCANTSDIDGRITVDLPWVGEQTYESLHPEAQKLYYQNVWMEDMECIFEKVYSDTLPPNATGREEAETKNTALKQATEGATGKDACVPNSPASAWFFFTVMTTIGYGNQAPKTQGGQAMVYTIGFLSILMFAATAASAGYIMTSLFDDIMKKAKLGILTSPIAATIFWGFLYYAWLVLIASFTDDWKHSRLGNDRSFDEGYWFAYISTTTVGLGDIYLEPEVLVTRDLMVFGLLFLIGFVFLASFLGSLGSFFKGVEHDELGDGKSIPESLEATPICCCRNVVKAGLYVGESVVRGAYHVGERVVKAGKTVVESGHQKV